MKKLELKKASGRRSFVHSKTTDVWEFLGISDEESSDIRLRAMIFEKISREIKAANITPRDLESILDEQQPRVSNLLYGKLEKFSSDKLFLYLEKIAPKNVFFLSEKKRVSRVRQGG